MIRLREVLTKEEAEKKWEEVVKEDCSYFIEKSLDLLQDGFFLYRVSTSDRGLIEHVEARKRRRIRGNPWRTFFYRQFKPSGVHNRRKMFACQGGEPPLNIPGKPFKIFPVGSNYKLYYHPNVRDFNGNELIDKYFFEPRESLGAKTENKFSSLLLDRVVMDDLHLEDGHMSGAETIKDGGLEDKFSEVIKRIGREDGNTLFGLIQTAFYDRGYDYKFGANKQFFWFLLDHRNELEDILEQTYSLIDTYKKYFEDYFSGLKEVQDLSKEMSNREVNIYAPEGVYYVRDTFDIPGF